LPSIPPNSLLYGARYDKIAGAFGAEGYNVESVSELDSVMKLVFGKSRQCPVIINVVLDPNSSRRPQVCMIYCWSWAWLSRSKYNLHLLY